MVDPKVIEAFHMMWDNFPAPVRLIYKDKKVLAVNEAAQAMALEPCQNCFDVGTPEQHKGCKAHEALSSNKGILAVNAEKDTIRYWLPVKDCPDIYVHFPLKLKAILE